MLKDLTTGAPGRVLALYAIPSIVSVLFQQMYNMADNVVAGRFIGEAALSAVSVCYPITMIYTSVALGINIGCSVLISQLFGAKRMEELKTAIATSLLYAIGLALALTALGIGFCRPLLALLNTPADLMEPTQAYLRIYTVGLLATFLYNTCTGVFTALGDTVTPLIFLIFSSLANIGLDVAMVTVFGMGVGGLALATVLCQGAAGLLAFGALALRLRKIPSGRWRFASLSLLKTIVYLSVPGIMQKSFVSVGNVMIQGLVNGFEASVPGIISGFSSANKFCFIFISINSAMSSAVASFTAQNIGGEKPERLRGGLYSGIAICFCVVAPAMVLCLGFPQLVMQLFVPARSTDVIAAGAGFLRIVIPFLPLLAVKQCCDGILQGAGSIREFMATTLLDLILRVALAFALGGAIGHLGIWWAWPLGWLFGFGLSVFFYRRGHWRKVQLLKKVS